MSIHEMGSEELKISQKDFSNGSLITLKLGPPPKCEIVDGKSTSTDSQEDEKNN